MSGRNVVGLPTATDTLVVFVDYRCMACATVHRRIDSALAAAPRLAVVYRHFPLSADSTSFRSALAVECASRFGRLSAGQSAVYRATGAPRLDWTKLARSIAIPPSRFRECLNAEDTRRAVEYDEAIARSLNLRGTPTAFFSGAAWSHVPDLPELLSLVNQR